MRRHPLAVAAAVSSAVVFLTLPPVVGAGAPAADLAPGVEIGRLSLPGVGNAVVLALNSIEIEQDVEVLSGDLVVDRAVSGPVIEEAALAVDGGATTPAGYVLKADTIDVDAGAVVGGDVLFNTLVNDGTVAGAQISPLALPVFPELPPLRAPFPRADAQDVTVPVGGFAELPADTYGNLVLIGNGAVRLTGGDYTFASITTGRGSALTFGAASRVVVTGRLSIGAEAVVGPEPTSGADASGVVFHVHGANGLDGALFSTPPAADVGKDATIAANLYAPFGSVILGRGVDAVGAFLGRDVQVERGSRIALASAFANRPPVALPQGVDTAGAAPIEITLSGVDPEGEDLSFAIVSGPAHGTLSTPVPIVPDPVIDPDTLETYQPPVTSATVVYTPDTADDLEDSFVFRATDPAGASGTAVVKINPPGMDEPPPPPPETVVVPDQAAEVFKDTARPLTLAAAAPDGVSVTFSIVPASGPSHGTLGPVAQDPQTPARVGTVVYTPDAGYLGPDSFQFEGCGEIASLTVCDGATFSLEVVEAPVEPPDLAFDRKVSTPVSTEVSISLSGSGPVSESSRLAPRVVVLRPRAAFLDGAEIAGNVADADGDGFGDEHNDLPGSVPVFMSAGVDQVGGAGSNGTVRMEIEWSLDGIGGLIGQLQTADVILHTHRGTVDSLDTFFWWVATGGDGALTDDDFEATAEEVPGVVMPVPPLSEMPLGADGTFSFSVLAQIQSAVAAGHDHLAIQGRVDESLAGPARGLEVRTTAAGNLADFLEPQLSLTTPGVTPPLVYSVLTLPSFGTLTDGNGEPILEAPYTLSGSLVRYLPASGFTGVDSFQFQVTDGVLVDVAVVDVKVVPGSCLDDAAFCWDGR